MDNKLITGGIVAAIILLGGVGYAVMSQKNGPPPPSAVVPNTQLTNELAPSSKPNPDAKSADGASHSTE